MQHRSLWWGSVASLVAVAGCVIVDDLQEDPIPPVTPCVSTIDPAFVASSQFYPAGLAIDDDHVYLADFFTDLSVGGGNIYRVPKAGGSVTPLYAIADVKGFRLEELTHHGGALFWREEHYANGTYFQRVRTMPVTGGPATDVAVGELVHFAVDDAYTYLTRYQAFDENVVERVPHGGSPEQLGIIMGQDTDIVADATHLYGVTFSEGIYQMPKTGGNPTYIGPDGRAFGGRLILDDDHVYRFEIDGFNSLTRFPKLGGADLSIDLPFTGDHWGSALLEGDDLYLRGTQSIVRIPKAGGGGFTALLCPDADLDLHYFAVDATRVFFFAMKPDPKPGVKPGVWAVDLP